MTDLDTTTETTVETTNQQSAAPAETQADVPAETPADVQAETPADDVEIPMANADDCSTPAYTTDGGICGSETSGCQCESCGDQPLPVPAIDAVTAGIIKFFVENHPGSDVPQASAEDWQNWYTEELKKQKVSAAEARFQASSETCLKALESTGYRGATIVIISEDLGMMRVSSTGNKLRTAAASIKAGMALVDHNPAYVGTVTRVGPSATTTIPQPVIADGEYVMVVSDADSQVTVCTSMTDDDDFFAVVATLAERAKAFKI